MKAIKTTVLFLIITFTAVAGNPHWDGIGVKGNGKVVKQEREVKGFTKLDISSAFNVYLEQGDREALTVEADENLMEIIVTKVSGNTLEIYTDESIRKYEELNIYLTFKDLEKIEVSGAVDIEGQGKMKFSELELDGSGASEIDLELTADVIRLDYSGASDVELSGYSGELSVELSGASQVDASDLECESVNIDASGASSIIVHANKVIEVDCSGASSVRYKGGPEKVIKDVSGAGSVKPY